MTSLIIIPKLKIIVDEDFVSTFSNQHTRQKQLRINVYKTLPDKFSMKELLKKLLPLKKTSTPDSVVNNEQKKMLIQKLLNDPNHEWIKNDRIMARSFIDLWAKLKPQHVQFFLKNDVFFIKCNALLSCAIGKTGEHQLILVFPDLVKILKSASPDHGLAILAHELGHIYYQHTEFKIETLKAQIEADDFAFELGLGEELQDILLDHNDSMDCKVRISKLTSKLITTKYATR